MFARFHSTIDSTLSPRGPATIWAISLVLLLLLGWLDYITGDYSLIIFYLIPISLVVWFVGKGSGLVFCVLSLATRLIADEAATSFVFQFSALHYWNMFVEFVFLLIMGMLLSALKRSLAKEARQKLADPAQRQDTSL